MMQVSMYLSEVSTYSGENMKQQVFSVLKDRSHLTTPFMSLEMASSANSNNINFVFVIKCEQ